MTDSTTRRPRSIHWPNVITVMSATILIGAEVFGGTFAAGWALSVLFGIGDWGHYVLQGVLFLGGVFLMVAFIRAAKKVEPFVD